MLILISDTHFVDASAGDHNIRFEAVRQAFADIAKYSGDYRNATLVYLGDIFDLNRTTHWIGVPEAERPWGDASGSAERIERHANDIFDKIIDANAKTFRFLETQIDKLFGPKTEKVFIPGNHDRLCQAFPSLRRKVRKHLGMKPGEDPFPHVFESDRYGVFACHGHEFDILNYEGSQKYTDADYALIPIGDLITSEIASRLPYTVLKNIDRMMPSMPPAEKASLVRNLQDIENVKPYSALFDWVFYQVRENAALRAVIDASLSEIIDNFRGLSYAKKWFKKHDSWLKPFDEADKLQAAFSLFKWLRVENVEKIFHLYMRLAGASDSMPMEEGDGMLIRAAQKILTARPDFRYVVMGHTHNPLQLSVRAASPEKEQVYLNTGTWRKKYLKSSISGFMNVKNITYTIIYSRDENPLQKFEAWSGILRELDS